jgi:hypothetical protein
MSRSQLATLALSALLTSSGLSAEAPSKAAPSKVVEKTLALAPDGRLVLDTYKGHVEITSWDREEVSVHAVVTPDGTCDTAADLVAKTQVRIEGGGREVRVESDYDDVPKATFHLGSDCGSWPFVRYEIRMPRGASLRLKDYKSRVSVDGLSGDVSVESYKGVARLAHLGGKLDLETYKGDFVAELDRVTGRVRAETYKGEIELVFPKGTNVDLDEKIGRHGVFENGLADAKGGTPVTVETYKGTIRLRAR